MRCEWFCGTQLKKSGDSMIKKIIKSIFCKHDYKLIRTIHGNQINHLDARSEWQCEKCKWITYGRYLDRIK